MIPNIYPRRHAAENSKTRAAMPSNAETRPLPARAHRLPNALTRRFELAPLRGLVEFLQRGLLSAGLAVLLAISSVSAPVAAQNNQPSVKATAVDAAPAPAVNNARVEDIKRIADELELIWAELRRLRPLGTAGLSALDIAKLSGDLEANAFSSKLLLRFDALGDIERAIEQQFSDEAREIAAANLPAAVQARLDSVRAETLAQALKFRTLLNALRAPAQQRNSVASATALTALLDWQALQPTAKGFRALGAKDLPTQFVRKAAAAQPSASFPVIAAVATKSTSPLATSPLVASVPAPNTAKAFTDPPTPADLAETIEVRFTPELDALSQTLSTPVAISNYVYNEIEFVPTWGSTQSAAMTLRNRRGSAADIASLTLALLRKAGIPARYAHGLVELPIERLQNWLDVKSPTLALDIIQSGGVPSVGVTAGGRLNAVRFEHVWVEAYLDFIPSRAEINRTPDQWVPMDLAYKQYTQTTALPILADVNPARLQALRSFAQNLQIEPIGRVRGFNFDQLAADNNAAAKTAVDGYLAQNPNLLSDDLYDRRLVQRNDAEFIAGSLPMTLRSSVVQRYSELPNTLRHKVRVQFFANEFALNSDSPTHELEIPLARVGTNTLSLDYDAATAADAEALATLAASNAARLNPSLINVRTKLRLGSEVLFDAGVTRMGLANYMRVDMRFPNGYISNTEAAKIITGSPTVLVFNQAGITQKRAEREAVSLPNGAALYDVKQTLYLGGLTYWMLHDYTDDSVARSAGGRATRLPSVGFFSMPYQVRYFFGIPRTGFQVGRSTDVKAATVALSVANNTDFAALALRVGAFGSMAESANWALLNGGGGGQGLGLTTTSILKIAIDEGQGLFQIGQSNVDAALASMNLSVDSENEIRSAVNQNQIVIAPERDIRYRDWTGTGYVVFDPVSGSSLQRVEGGLAGGIEWGCIAVAVVLKILCDKKILARASAYLAAIGARLLARSGLALLFAAIAPGVGVVLAIISAVQLAIALAQAVAEVTRWVQSIMAGIETLTLDEMLDLGIKAVNEVACNYAPPCLPWLSPAGLGFGGGGGGGGSDPRGGGGPLTGNPVAVGSGAKWQYEFDYEATGPFPLKFVRVYNSESPRTASFIGSKWTANYFQSVRAAPDVDDMRADLPTGVMVTRPEGGWFQFDLQNGVYVTRANLPGTLERLTFNGRLSGWRYRTAVDTIEDFDADGRLLSVRDRAGLVHSVSYDVKKRPITVTDSYGRTLQFRYDATSGYLESLIEASNRTIRFTHDADGNLTRVTYPDASTKQYHFEDIDHRFALTGITDERGIRVTNWLYNSDGKVKRYARAGDVDVHLFSYVGNKTTVTDPLGTLRTYSYQLINDRPYMTEVTQPCSSCGSAVSAKTYDARGLIDSETDFRGTVTRFERDNRALVTKMTEAQGKPEQRVTNAQYEAQWHLLKRAEEPITGGVRVRELTYDGEGNATELKVTVGPQTRTTTMTYNGNGQKLTADGPRTDVQDLETWTYDASGNVETMTNALGHKITYNSYNADGQVTKMTDANGLITEYRYDERMRLVERIIRDSAAAIGEITKYDYTPFGDLDKVTLADGSFLSYSYDSAQRLTKVTDSLGHKRVYTLNNNGDIVKADTKDADGILAQTMSKVIDNLGRVKQSIGASANEVIEYSYDGNGNEKTALDPNQNLTSSEYDALNRIITTTDPDLKAVNFKYDPQDNLTEVSDPRTLKTTYGYSGFNELTKLTSPDTGVTDYTYDASGNLSTRKDARIITAIYTYDRANRVSTISYPAITGVNAQPAETLTFVYDEASGGAGAKGRLTTATDGTATTTYQYDRHGRVTSKAQAIGSITKTQTMSYKPNGQLDEHTLPSGAVIKYSYRADGRVVTISVNGVAITREIEYFAFGEPKSWKLGASGNDQYLRTFDTNGRVKEHTAGAATRAIGFDPASRITSISDGAAGPSWTYGYDKLDRLKTADSTQLKLEWGFDATGNRLSEKRAVGVAAPITTAYAIDAVSNKLSSVGTTNRTYDSVGNTTLIGTDSSVYSARNRLVQVNKNGVLANYDYNVFGERVIKTVGGSTAQFVYDENLHLLGEYDVAGALTSEYVWLGDVPVAVIKPSSSTQGGIIAGTSKVYLIQPDHLNTPRVIVNAANQVVWRWDSAPFGDTNANEQPTASLATFQFNLRFLGQQFDLESDTHYNYSRDYEPSVGRYTQSDFLGLEGGHNTYLYVYGMPMQLTDARGEAPKWLREASKITMLLGCLYLNKRPPEVPKISVPPTTQVRRGGGPPPRKPPNAPPPPPPPPPAPPAPSSAS